jgi:glucokinase
VQKINTISRLIAVDMGGSHITVALSYPDGQIISRTEVRSDFTPDDPESNLAQLFQLLDDSLEELTPDSGAVLAMGVPATLNSETGIVNDAPILGWVDLPLKTILEERYRLPTLIENDVNLACLGEAKFGTGQAARNLVCMMIGTNIGGGIILDGKLYRGSNGAAGEIGWMVPDPTLLGQVCTVFGGLERYAGGRGIATRAQEFFKQNGTINSQILQAVHGNINSIRSEHVFEAALRADPVAQTVLDKAIDYLAVSIANIISLFDPELIVISGGVARSGEILIEGVRERIKGLVLHHPPLLLSVLGEDAVLYGALSLAQSY